MNQTGIISEEILRKTVHIYEGNIPVVLTVPHDGKLTNINNTILPKDPQSKKADLFVSIIASFIQSELFLKYGFLPWIVIEKVHRSCRTPEITEAFNQSVLNTIEGIKDKNILLLDLHGFSSTDKYDVILGTGHRKTIGRNNEDILLASHLKSMNLNIYLPRIDILEDEFFTAESPETIVQIVKNKFKDENITAIQVEISKEYRNPSNPKNMTIISSAIASFIGEKMEIQVPSYLFTNTPNL